MQHEGEKGEALLVFRNPKIENKEVFAQYTKVLLEPVQLYAGPGSTLPEAPEEQRVPSPRPSMPSSMTNFRKTTRWSRSGDRIRSTCTRRSSMQKSQEDGPRGSHTSPCLWESRESKWR